MSPDQQQPENQTGENSEIINKPESPTESPTSAAQPPVEEAPASTVIQPTAQPAEPQTPQADSPEVEVPATVPAPQAPEPFTQPATSEAVAGAVPPPKKSKKKRYFAIGGAAVLLLSIAGFVFGYYLPNQPDNVYNTGLKRSGKAIQSMVEAATEKEKLEQVEKSEIKGSLELKADQGTYSGDFTLMLDKTKTNGNLNFAYKADGADKKITADFMTKLEETSRFPDIYFKVGGIQELVGDFIPGLEAYDNQWVEVSSAYLEQFGGDLAVDEPKNSENLSADETASLIRTISDVTNEYVFTDDTTKAVLEKKSFVGKEKTAEGVNAFRYKVGINAEHAKSYCKAMVERVTAEAAYRKLLDITEKEAKEHRDAGLKGCNEDLVKDLKSDDTFDMWVDSKYKIIHKVRFTEDGKEDNYVDIGQVYTGGDKIALFTTWVNKPEKLSAKFTLDVNIKQSSSEGKLVVKSESESDFFGAFEFEAGLSAKPFDGDVPFNKPANSIPIDRLLEQFGYDPASASGADEDLTGETVIISDDTADDEDQISDEDDLTTTEFNFQ